MSNKNSITRYFVKVKINEGSKIPFYFVHKYAKEIDSEVQDVEFNKAVKEMEQFINNEDDLVTMKRIVELFAKYNFEYTSSG